MFSRVLGVILCLAALALLFPGQAQTAPMLASVTPTNGAVNVPTTSPLVFVFDQAMDTSVPFFQSIPNVIVGNFEIESPGFNQQLMGTWGADERTLTVQPVIQFPYGTFDWTLNPAGALDFFQIKSKAGVELAPVSGTFSTGVGGEAPKLGSSTPANGAFGVSVDVLVTFRFDQPMNTNLAVADAVVWTGVSLDPTKFSYSWSADGRSLFCDYATNLPLNTLINWKLNPAAAPVKLESQSGVELASDTYSGHFLTEAVIPCEPTGVPSTWGNYSVYRNSSYDQESAADPVPASGAPFIFGAIVSSPTAGPAATSGSLTWPDGSHTNLTALGVLQFFESFPSEAGLEAGVPAGVYTLRFTQTGQAEQVIPMTMPGAPPPVPKILNFADTQSVDVDAALTLQWNGFPGATGDDFISLYISDSLGHPVFQAPDRCVPRDLPVTATSIVIPAHTFQTNITYSASLLFARAFYFSTNAVPQMAGYGSIQSITHFSIVPSGSAVVPAVPAVLGDYQLLPNGDLSFALTGTAGHGYAIQRAAKLDASSWPQIGTVTMDASGHAEFEDSPGSQKTTLFYRAVAN